MRTLPLWLIYFAFVGAAAAEESAKAWLGVELTEVTKTDAEKLGWEAPAGAKVVSVDPKGPAAAKLRKGDVIVLLDGFEVESKSKFEAALGEKVATTEIKLKVRRGPKERRVAITLGALVVEQAAPSLADTPEPKIGLQQTSSAQSVGGLLTPAERALLNQPESSRQLESFRDCPECPEMVAILPGSFTMGSPETEPERSVNEGPQHLVTIAKPFAVGKFAVTFAEWDACAAAGGCSRYKPKDEGWGRGDRPVINVSWNDTKAYVAWLSKKTGKTYRLLSEAEREYITRAGSDTPFWWGVSIAPDQANYDGTGDLYKGGGMKGEYRKKTLPVKSFEPNPWGLYQVHGNVYEWVEDCWNDSYNGAPPDGSAWMSGDCSYRVLRGGSWNLSPPLLRTAFRINAKPADRDRDQGFRVALTLGP